MFTDRQLETTIREIVERRLKVGGDDCLISIKPVAKTARAKLGWGNNQGRRKAMCEAVFRVLQQYDIKLWGYTSRKMQIRNKDKMPLSLHIYRVRR